MTNRAIVTGLIFGPIGAGLPAAVLFTWYSLWPDVYLGLRGIVPAVLASVAVVAAIAAAVAVASLIVGAIVGDLASSRGRYVGRLAGTAAASVITATAHLSFLRPTPLPLVAVFTAYAAMVAWLRLPWILAWRPSSTTEAQ